MHIIYTHIKKEEFIFTISHTKLTKARKDNIWNILKDAQNWDKWDKEIEITTLDGPFEKGTTGTLKTKNSPLFKTKLIKVVPKKMFIQEINLKLVKFHMIHILTNTEDGCKVTFQTQIKGLLAPIYHWFLKSSIQKKLPLEMDEMLKLATSN